MIKKWKLPELGEGIESADLISISVEENQDVKKDQTLIVIESDKATLEIPAGYNGVIEKILCKPGDIIKPEQILFEISIHDNAESEKKQIDISNSDEKSNKDTDAVENKEIDISNNDEKSNKNTDAVEKNEIEIAASPSVRRFANEYKLDLSKIKGSGLKGRITIDDVKDASIDHDSNNTSEVNDESQKNNIQSNNTDSGFESQENSRVKKYKISSRRNAIAKNLHRTWNSIPHVLHMKKADIKKIEKLRKGLKAFAEQKNIKLTLLPFIIKALVAACKEFPQFNSEYALEQNEIIEKHYYNIGLAMDTPEGLTVPVLRDADKKSIFEITVMLHEMQEKVKANKMQINDYKDHTISISNLGAIGGEVFSPIINAPDVAILGIMRSKTEAVYKNNKLKKSMLLPLCLCYDHRIIDGADAARFVNYIVELLEHPKEFLLYL